MSKVRLPGPFTFCLSGLNEPLSLFGLQACPSRESRTFHYNQKSKKGIKILNGNNLLENSVGKTKAIQHSQPAESHFFISLSK
jgi:hypothetical protein